MNKNQINPVFVLAAGLVLIGAVLVSLGVEWLGEGAGGKTKKEEKAPEKPSVSKTVSAPKMESERKPIAKAKERIETSEQRQSAAADSAAEITEILLEQIKESPADLNLDWLASFCKYIRTEADLQSYFKDILALGATYETVYVNSQKKMKRTPSTNPHYFIEEARKLIYAKKRSARKMKKNCREWLALAYYKGNQQEGGWENLSDEFMGAFFQETITLYQALQDSALEQNKDVEVWLNENIKTHEAALMDRYLRTLEHAERGRERLKGSASSGAVVVQRLRQMDRRMNELLLSLGGLYLGAAERETSNIEKLRFYAERTFQSMAMVYQRKPSGTALSGIRQVNQIQRDYLYRMALLSWQRAKVAAAAGRSEEADEYYFLAKRRFLQCMARWREVERGKHLEEFRKLTEDFASWQAQKQKRAAVEGT